MNGNLIQILLNNKNNLLVLMLILHFGNKKIFKIKIFIIIKMINSINKLTKIQNLSIKLY